MRPLWRQTDLPELVATLLSRPGHEAVRTLVADILRHGFGAIINSDLVLQRVIPRQSRGWRDPRDFDNLVWELPVPEFDGSLELHRQLAAAGTEAETTAAAVVLPEGDYRRKRRAIRDALAGTGLAARMDALVGRLLDA